MIDISGENESFGEMNVTQENQLFNDNVFFSLISPEEECNNYNISTDDNKNPYSFDNIKIEYKTIEETNSKTLSCPDFLSLDEIKEVLKKNFNDVQIINKLDEGNSIEMSEGYEFLITKKKRKRDKKKTISPEEKKNDGSNKKPRGRQPKNPSGKKHDKMTPDNIIKKIKNQLFDYNLKFINSLLIKIHLNVELFKINYKFIDQLKCEKEARLLKSSLKEILSLDISPRYKQKKSLNYNRTVIEALIKSQNKLNERDDSYYDTLMFVLNMTFSGWFDVFTGKNTFKNLANDYTGNKEKINFDLIEKSFVGINNLLNNILEEIESDYEYFALFVFYIYNYERWFFIRDPRNKNKNKK